MSDLAQETWAEVWKHFPTFDPDQGSFWTFTRIWAGYVLTRFRSDAASDPIGLALQAAAPQEEANSSGAVESLARSVFERGSCADMEQIIDGRRALFDLTCRWADARRPPHEIIVFGFSKLEWKPKEILAELASRALQDLAEKLEHDYGATISAADVRPVFRPLHVRLTLHVGEVLPDARSRARYAHLLHRITGSTTLSDYLPAERQSEAVITQWWDTVKRSVLTDVHTTGLGRTFLAVLSVANKACVPAEE